MRPLTPRVQTTLTVALSLIAALTLTLLASGAFAHTGADGGHHHDLLNIAHHLTDLQDWLAQVQLEAWVVLPPVLAVCAWLTLRWFHKKSKRAASSTRPSQHKDQP
ncbi:MAG: hypothetical protein HEQ39_04110 [Rhizobacter sp.]